MFNLIGSARNISGLLIDGLDGPVGDIEVILIGTEPTYGFTPDGQLAKGGEVKHLRFHSSPEGLKHLADRLVTYAEEGLSHFGPTPKLSDVNEEEVGNDPESLPDANGGTPGGPGPKN